MAKLTAFEHDPKKYTRARDIMELYKDNFRGMKNQYTKLRDVAEKRRKRALAGKYKDYSYVQKHAEPFTKLADINSPEELAEEMRHIARYLLDERSTAKGLEARVIKIKTTLEAHYGKMSYEEFLTFDQLMREWHVRRDMKNYDSDRVAEFFTSILPKYYKDLTKAEIMRYLKKYMKSQRRLKNRMEDMS